MCFGPTVAKAARFRWCAARIEAEDEATRWAARGELLALPREDLEPVLPRIVAAMMLECAEDPFIDVVHLASLSESVGWDRGDFREATVSGEVREVLRGDARSDRRGTITARLLRWKRPFKGAARDAAQINRRLSKLVGLEDEVIVVLGSIAQGALREKEILLVAPLDSAGVTVALLKSRLAKH